MSLALWAFVVSLLAIGVSLYGLSFNRNLEHQASCQTLIHDQYELCRVLDMERVDHPELSHMLALPSQRKDDAPWWNYDLLKREVRTILEGEGPITTETISRLYLKEHALALHVCNIYEQTLLQLDLAVQARDTMRKKILNDLVKYYEGRMLRNPRFRYHWDHGASDMMELEPTRKRFEEYVRQAYPDDYADRFSPLEAEGSLST